MVKIAISGGSGNVGQEVVDALAATGNHEILVLSRKDYPPKGTALQPGVTWVKADYGDVEQLTRVLQGVDTVLCFIIVHMDEGNLSQNTLIDAAVRAGVRRFAPSEWVSDRMDHMPWMLGGKMRVRGYLEELNKEKKVLEYSLFHPGLFMNYLTHPHQSAKHLLPISTPIDFYRRRALILDGSDDVRITLTTVQDLANIVVAAVEYEGQWPLMGGIQGDNITMAELLGIGEKTRGGQFDVERLDPADLKAGIVHSSWKPKIEHPSITAEQIEELESQFVSGIVLSMGSGVMDGSDEWNKLLPEYNFTSAEAFLSEFWYGKE